MAVNWESLVKDLFGGDAQINVWPVTYNSQYVGLYLSLDDPDCPATVKELYKFNLDKAKALMKEAGYPNGFKTTVICSNGTTVVDYYSVTKEMWSKLGIYLTIDARESAVHTSIWRGQQWTDLCYSSMGGLGTAFTGGNIYGDQSSNGSRVRLSENVRYHQRLQSGTKVRLLDGGLSNQFSACQPAFHLFQVVGDGYQAYLCGYLGQSS